MFSILHVDAPVYQSLFRIVGLLWDTVPESSSFLGQMKKLSCYRNHCDHGFGRRKSRPKSYHQPRRWVKDFGQLYAANTPQCDRKQSNSRRIAFGSSFVAWIPPDLDLKHQLFGRTMNNLININPVRRYVLGNQLDKNCGQVIAEDEDEGANRAAVSQWKEVLNQVTKFEIIKKIIICPKFSKDVAEVYFEFNFLPSYLKSAEFTSSSSSLFPIKPSDWYLNRDFRHDSRDRGYANFDIMQTSSDLKYFGCDRDGINWSNTSGVEDFRSYCNLERYGRFIGNWKDYGWLKDRNKTVIRKRGCSDRGVNSHRDVYISSYSSLSNSKTGLPRMVELEGYFGK